MGITGLLPFVKNACRQGNIKELKSQSVAVDVSCLLHRGLTGCMDKIHMGENTQSYVHYVERYIKELIALDCHIVMVFDGRPLPAKKQTNDDRREQRDKNMQHGELLLAKGLEKEAREKFRLATKISSDIVENTIKYFRNWKNVDIVVAPYEADAQLAYLMKSNLVDAVITEDSDLIVFECERIYFKWQSGSGECSIYERENLHKCFNGEMAGNKFDFIKFRRICILAGCDYLQSGLPGVGLSTATKFFSKTSISDLRILLKKIPNYLNNQKLKNHITEEFINSFIRAENTFKYQVVFDPKERCQRPLNPYPLEEIIDLESDENQFTSTSNKYEFAGTICSQKLAQRLALGNDTNNGCLEDQFLLNNPQPNWSIWSDKYESKGKLKKKLEKEKEISSTFCGAFKVDPASAKRNKRIEKSSEKSIKKGKFDNFMEDDDDIVAQFIQDVEKEKTKVRKRKNEPDENLSAEMLMNKYGNAKKQKQNGEIDDFDEIFETKKPEQLETKNDKEEQIEEIRPPPIVRKIVSSPAVMNEKPDQLTTENSRSEETQSASTNSAKKSLGKSKYFREKNGVDSSPKISNPFRCPAFVKPIVPNKDDKEMKKEIQTKETSILSGLEEKTETSSPFRFVGFKVSGLRRTSSAK